MYLQIFGALVVAYIVYRVLNRGKYAKYPPFSKEFCLPFFGHLIPFAQPVDFLMEQHKKFGDIWSFQLFGWDCVSMSGTEAQQAFYGAPEAILSAREAYQFTIPAFGKGIIYDAPDEKFQEERRWLTSLLVVKSFENYVPIMESEVEAYMKEFWNQDSGVIDFTAAIGEIIIRTSTHCLQGPEIRAQSKNYAAYMDDIDAALSVLAFFYPYLPLPSFKKRNDARKKIGVIVKAILKQRRANPESKPDESDVIQMMMNKTYKSRGTPVTDDEIAGFCVALMLAGQHTSTITSSWLAIHLLSATGQKVLDEVMKEQKEVLSKNEPGQALSYENVRGMKFLEASMKEVLRVRPPIILVWRKAVTDFKYKEYVVPAGTLVAVSPAAFPRLSDDIYKNPNEFDPWRFGEDRAEDKVHACSYIAFSSGRHACIGEKFAFLQIKTVFSVFLKHYDLKLVGDVKDYPVDTHSMLAGPVGPVKLQYTKRK